MAIGAPFLVGAFIHEYIKYKREVGEQLKDLRKEIKRRDSDALNERQMRQQERIETLEAIVTDSKFEVANNISKLQRCR